jgi:hypothetical protein
MVAANVLHAIIYQRSKCFCSRLVASVYANEIHPTIQSLIPHYKGLHPIQMGFKIKDSCNLIVDGVLSALISMMRVRLVEPSSFILPFRADRDPSRVRYALNCHEVLSLTGLELPHVRIQGATSYLYQETDLIFRRMVVL